MIMKLLIIILLVYLVYHLTYKYESYTNVEQDMLTKLKYLTLSVSHTNILIMKNKNILLQETDTDLVIYIIKHNTEYYKKLNIDNEIQNITKDLDNDDIIIILRKTSKIPSKSFFDAIKQIGGKFNIIRNNENYILVTNKSRTIYFELASPEPIYYPYVMVNSID